MSTDLLQPSGKTRVHRDCPRRSWPDRTRPEDLPADVPEPPFDLPFVPFERLARIVRGLVIGCALLSAILFWLLFH